MSEFSVFFIIAAVFLLVIFFCSYKKVPKNKIGIRVGPFGNKTVTGKAVFVVPFLQRIDYMTLENIQVDFVSKESIPTQDAINIKVDAIANIAISQDNEIMKKAAAKFIGYTTGNIADIVKPVLEGNIREIISQIKLKDLIQGDKKVLAEQIAQNVKPNLEDLGLELTTFNIQNFKDAAGTIENMGIDNVEQIRKNAQIAKANAQRDIAIATANAQQEANAVKVEAEKKIAEQDAALSVQQAEMKVKADTKKAEADAAYSIQQENQRKTIEVAKTEADIARREKEAELAEKEIAIKDAKKYEAIAAADAKRAEAEALRFAMEQEAEGIRAKGLAEAEAIEKKAEAQKKMGEASVLEMYLEALPEVVKNAAAPLERTDKIVMYGDGNSTKLVRDVMNSANQVVDGMRESTGIDLASLLAGNPELLKKALESVQLANNT